MRRVALEGAVRDRPLLQPAEARHPVVRLPEDSLPDQTDRHEQHGGAHERDEQLGVDLEGQAADRTDDRIVAPAQRPPLLDDGSRLLLRWPNHRHPLTGSACR